MQKAIYKVPNGKLIKVALEQQDGKITNLKITGDFFIYPEEKIEDLQNALIGRAPDKMALMDACAHFHEKHSPELFGIDYESISNTILQASNTPQ